MTDRIKEPWGTRTPYAAGEPWPVRVDTFLEDGVSEDEVDRWAQTASLHHANGDAMDLAVKEGQCDAHAEALKPFVDRYGEQSDEEPERLYHDLFDETRSGSFGLLRDLQDLYVMANYCDITWTMIGQAAQGAGDVELLEAVNSLEGQTSTQIKWLKTRMKQAAPQTLLVASS